jgi:hypothetical protein
MENLQLKDICQMARENGMRVITKSDGYALCDENLETLVVATNWRRLIWYINNCDILGIVKV